MELSGYLEHFSEAKGYQEGAGEDYRYRSRLSWVRLRYARNPGQGHGIRLGLQFVRQDSDAGGFREFDYQRREWLPSLFYSYTRGAHAAELGLMGALYAWELDHLREPEDEEKDGLTEKVKLGYTYSFLERGSVQISISHVLSYMGFGGGSVQFNLGL
jgi:hypothetical protein